MTEFLALVILIVHFLFVLGVVIPVPLLMIGAWRGWRWIRNRVFRLSHLAMIGIVVLETILGIFCPLTEWEQSLRRELGQESYEGAFVAYWVSRLLYYDYAPWVFTVAYLAFGAVIVGLYFLVPPRPKAKRG